MPLLVAEQRTEAWYADRKGKITASLAAACLGLVKGYSRQKAWRVATGRQTEPMNDDMRRGIEHEADAVYAWECSTGMLAQPTGFWIHPELTWLGASPDGLVGADGVLDVKCPRKLPDELPPKYRVQLAVQMCVTGRTVGHFGAWVDGQEPFVDSVQWDPIADSLTIAALTTFYHKYIVTNTQPERAKRSK